MAASEPGGPRTGTRLGRAVPALAAVVGVGLLLVLAALGTRAAYSSQLIPSAQHSGVAESVSAAVGQVVMVTFFAVVDLVILAMVVFAPWDRFQNVGKPGVPVAKLNRRAKVRLVAFASSLVLAEVAILILGLHRRTQPRALPPSAGTPPPLHRLGPNSAATVQMPETLLLSLIIAVVVAVAALGYWLLRRRRSSNWRSRTGSEPPAVALPEEIAGALEGGLDEIGSGSNPREAVIAAYARMERALAAHGIARRAPETHLEYLDRALKGMLPSRRSLERLTDLFEQARYSEHPVTRWDKSEAESALTHLRNELRVSP